MESERRQLHHLGNRTESARGECVAYVSSSCPTTTGICQVTPTRPTNIPRPPAKGVTPIRERIAADYTQDNKSISNTDLLNTWLNSHTILYDSGKTARYGTNRYIWSYARKIVTPTRTVRVSAFSDRSLREARDFANFLALRRLDVVCQMESDTPKESDQGLAIQDSDRSSNTIVTRDEGKVETQAVQRTDCSDFASSEAIGSFDLITNRWMPLPPLTISTADELGKLIKAYYLPETLYSAIKDAANLIPFETFIYAELDVTFKFVVNANKFQCGKVLVSCKFDSYQADAVQSSVRSSLHRPHVLLDLSSNNEGELHVPFRYHRAFVRLQNTDRSNSGVRPAKYASVYVQVLSPLRTGPDNATDMFIRPFVKLEKIKFAGMSHRISLQMESALSTIGPPVLSSLLSATESLLTSSGTTENRDKPTENRATIIIPKPRYNFATGKGPTDALPLRMDPTTMTSYNCVVPYADDPKTTLAIAQTWGLRSTFTWSQANAPGTLLYSFHVDPSVRTYDAPYVGVPTPLEYITSMYNFWSGTIEMRLDFISNSFHTGTIQISVEFNRPTQDNDDESKSASCYTKTFHLGEQKTVSLTIPYIYDTVWRRSCSMPYNPARLNNQPDDDAAKKQATALYANSRTVVSIRVLNELRPVASTTQEIDVQLYWRATPSFRVHSLKQSACYFTREYNEDAREIDNFPARYEGDEGEAGPDGRAADDDSDDPPRELPDEKSNQYNEYDTEHIPTDPDLGQDDISMQIERPPGLVMPNEMPRLQMDSGEKEARDSTLDFSYGSPALHVQTVDSQTNIKDILRRPVLLLDKVTVSGLDNGNALGFYIPLIVPSRNLGITGSSRSTSIFSRLLTQTPQAQLLSLFRFWRGSMRYTILVESPDFKQPIYITHMPHSGVRLMGNRLVNFRGSSRAEDAKAFEAPIYGTGLSTEILVPQVNPTIQVEVPFDTENNWCLTFEEDPGRRYTWRDKGDTNCGHLVITCKSDVVLTIFWQAGDDFEIANFYGIPNCAIDDHRRALSDVKFQMESAQDDGEEDFHDADDHVPGYDVTALYQRHKSHINNVATVAATQIPIVGNLVMGYKAVNLANKAEQVMDDVSATTANLNGLMDNVNSKLDENQSMIRTLYDQLMAFFNKAMGATERAWDWVAEAADVIFQLASAIVLRSWEVAATAIVGIFLKCFAPSAREAANMACHLASKLAAFPQLIGRAISRFFEDDEGRPRLQGPSTESTLVGLCAALVGIVFNVALDPSAYTSKFEKLMKQFTTSSGISYINQVVRLFNTIFDTLKDMVFRALGMVSPEAKALQMFSASSDIIAHFIRDAQLITCDANASMMCLPSFRTKFWLTMVNAYQIQSTLCRLPSQAASATLAKLCSDVIRIGNERMVDLTSCPVRYEPFVLCIEGEAGIGKSFLNEFLVQKLLAKVDYKKPCSGLVYIRQPGSEYWSGYRDQPVVTYDDMFNLNDTQMIVQAISEFYQLKSTAPFIPNMAHLEDKRIRGNPLLVTMLCNNAFPSHISSAAIHKDAVYRRRDCLVKARLKAGYDYEKVKTLEGAESENMEHLEFCLHRNPRYQTAGYRNEWLNWKEFVEMIETKFHTYHQREMKNVSRRIRELQSALTNLPADKIDLKDPFKVFWDASDSRMSEEAFVAGCWMPSEELTQRVAEASAAVEESFAVTPNSQTQPKTIDDGTDVTLQMEATKLLKSDREKFRLKNSVPLPTVLGGANPTNLLMTGGPAGSSSDWSSDDSSPLDELPETPCGIPGSKVRMASARVHQFPFLESPGDAKMTWTDDIFEFLVGCIRRDWRHTCSMCHFKKFTTVCCSAPENVHYFCMECIKTYHEGAGDEQLPCPYCSLSLTPMEPDTDLMRAVKLCYKATSTELRRLYRYVSKLDGVQVTLWTMVFNGVLACTSFKPLPLFKRLIPFAGLYSAYRVGAEMYRRATHERRANGYIYYPIGDEDQPIEPIPLSEVLNRTSLIAPNMQRFETFVKDVRHQGHCFHHDVYNAMTDDTTFFSAEDEGTWNFILGKKADEFYARVSDKVCGPECMLAKSQTCEFFYQRWAQCRRKELAQLFSDYLTRQWGNSAYRAKVPFMLRPAWMTPPKFSLLQSWWTYLSEGFCKYRKLITFLVGVGAASAALLGVLHLFNHPKSYRKLKHNINSISPIKFQSKLYEADNIKHLKRVHKNTKIRGKKVKKTYKPRSNLRMQGEDVHHNQVRQQVRNNYVTIRVFRGASKTPHRTMTGVGVLGRAVLIPKHFSTYIADAAKQGYRLTIERTVYIRESGSENADPNHTQQDYTYDKSDFYDHPTIDASIFMLPVSFTCLRNIKKHFAMDEDIESGYLPFRATLEIVPSSVNRYIDSKEVELDGLVTRVDADYEYGVETLRDVVTYNYARDGACGSMLVLHRSQRPILAMHSAGNSAGTLGYGTIVTQEILDELLPPQAILQMEEPNDLDSFGERSDAFTLSIDANVDYIGVVKPGMEHFSPVATKLRKSDIHEVGELVNHSEPTILSSRDPRYPDELKPYPPLWYGANKHGIKTIDLPSSVARSAGDALWRGWFSMMRPTVLNPKTLSYEEAVVGIPNVDFYDAMKLVTSAGYPWTLLNPNVTTKEAWIEAERDPISGRIVKAKIHPDVIAEIERTNALRKQRIQPITIFADTLKDERKLKEKIRKPGATRVFCASPTHFTILCRQHLLHFCAAVMRERFGVMCAVGINAKGAEWSDLYDHLRSIGSDNIVALDYSNFGPGFNAVLAEQAKNIMLRWCQKYVADCDPDIVEVLLFECINSCHVVRNTVYQQQSGSPSGAPITTIINSIVNLLHVFSAWIVLTKYQYPEDTIWYEFRKHVRLVVYGDDLIMNVSDEAISFFNTNTLKSFFARYRIVATGTEKTLEEEPDCVSIDEAQFLKRSFLRHPTRPGRWLSPLKWTSVEDAAQWIWSCADTRAATLINCESALREAHGHGPKVFDEFQTKINDALRKVGEKKGLALDWYAIDNVFFDDYPNLEPPPIDSEDRISLQLERPRVDAPQDFDGYELSPNLRHDLDHFNAAATLLSEGHTLSGVLVIQATLFESNLAQSLPHELVEDFDPGWLDVSIESEEQNLADVCVYLVRMAVCYVRVKLTHEGHNAFQAGIRYIRPVLDMMEQIAVEELDDDTGDYVEISTQEWISRITSWDPVFVTRDGRLITFDPEPL